MMLQWITVDYKFSTYSCKPLELQVKILLQQLLHTEQIMNIMMVKVWV